MLPAGVRGELQLAVERFLYYEAWLLDERRLYDWLELFTEDATYSVGVREMVQGAEDQIAALGPADIPLTDDDHAFMTMRVKRLETRLAHAEQPPSLTRHLITNVLVHDDPASPGPASAPSPSPLPQGGRGWGEGGVEEIRVSSNFLVFQTRIDIADHTFFGKRDDLLRRVDGQWRIARRRIVVDKSPLPNVISIFF